MNIKGFHSALLLGFFTAMGAPGAVLFFDDFSGPSMSSSWQASLPNANLAGPQLGFVRSATYAGAPNHSFQFLEPASVLRMSSTLDPLQRRGWSSCTVFGGDSFRYEARFNSLVQSATTSIDSFIELWLIDAVDPTKYDIVSPFGGEYSSSRRFFLGSSIDGSYSEQFYPYENNTWYRLVLEGKEGQNIRASLLSDAGVELVGGDLSHTAGVFSSGFRIALSQAMGVPYDAAPSDVAVDYVSLTGVPEPGSLALGVCAFLLWAVRRRNESAA